MRKTVPAVLWECCVLVRPVAWPMRLDGWVASVWIEGIRRCVLCSSAEIGTERTYVRLSLKGLHLTPPQSPVWTNPHPPPQSCNVLNCSVYKGKGCHVCLPFSSPFSPSESCYTVFVSRLPCLLPPQPPIVTLLKLCRICGEVAMSTYYLILPFNLPQKYDVSVWRLPCLPPTCSVLCLTLLKVMWQWRCCHV